MKTAIVTGANGFVGSAVTRELLMNGYHIYSIVRGSHGSNLPQDKNVTLISCDLAELEFLPQKYPELEEADIFYHFAWMGSAGPARADTKLQLQNVQWTVDALRTAKRIGCKRFLCAGSIMEHETMSAAYTRENLPG